MNKLAKFTVAIATLVGAAHAGAQITFYEHDEFQGRSYNPGGQSSSLSTAGFNDQASSAIVTSGRWEICEDDAFGGRCVILRPGQYPSFSGMNMNDRISSVRSVIENTGVNDDRYVPFATPALDTRRRGKEELFVVDVTSVRAVVGTPDQRCWVEPEQVPQASQASKPNVGGAVVGAILGGILGHQVGGGAGKDLATVGGVIVGGAIGSQVGRGGTNTNSTNNTQPSTQSVQRCTTMPSQTSPALWDVGYTFRGQDHQVQMTTQPGTIILVNRNGEPRTVPNS